MRTLDTGGADDTPSHPATAKTINRTGATTRIKLLLITCDLQVNLRLRYGKRKNFLPVFLMGRLFLQCNIPIPQGSNNRNQVCADAGSQILDEANQDKREPTPTFRKRCSVALVVLS